MKRVRAAVYDNHSQILEKGVREFGLITNVRHACTYRHGQIARKEPVLEDTPVGDVNALALIRHNDHRPT
jgi:hypothetical protein